MKDRSVQITKRDQQLLSILLALILVYLCYYFVANPALNKGTLLVEEIAIAQEDLMQAEVLVQQLDNLERDTLSKKDELNDKYSYFLSEINEASILHQLDGQFTSTNFVVNSYQQSSIILGAIEFPISTFSPSQYPIMEIAKKLNPELIRDFENGNNITTEETKNSETNIVEQKEITIGFVSTTYDSLYLFIKSLEELGKTFIVSDIMIARNPELGNQNGQVILRAISLPKINSESDSDLSFVPILPIGKTSPF